MIIFSAPSGAGKSTIVNKIINDLPDMAFSVSATSRKMRAGEEEGVHYYYLTLEEFQKKIADNELLEYEEVYSGVYYGTLKSEIERLWSEGKNVIFDIDVIGALNVKKMYGDKAISIFIQPPSVEVLEERLTKRNSDAPESIKTRLDKAVEELSYANEFDKIVVNDVLEVAVEEVLDICKEFLNV